MFNGSTGSDRGSDTTGSSGPASQRPRPVGTAPRTGRGAPRKSYAKGIARRQQILDAALAEYGQPTRAHPTLKAIAARVGLTEAGVLHHFTGLDELYVAILQERDTRALAQHDLTSLEGLLDYLYSTTATPGLCRLYIDMAAAAADPRHPAHVFIHQHREYVLDLLHRVLPNTTVSGRRVLLAAIEGLQMQWLTDPGIDPVEDLRDLMHRLEDQAPPRA